MAIPSDDQMLAFGKIMHHYASAEAGIKLTLAGLLGAEVHKFFIMAEPYSAMSLRNVAKSLARDIWPDEKDAKKLEVFCQIVGDLGAFGPLRSAIGHSRWHTGTRPNSIKPAYIDIRSGTAKYYGADEEERDWIAAELHQEAKKLLKLNQRIVAFMEASGAKARIDDMEARIRAEIEALEGNSTNAS